MPDDSDKKDALCRQLGDLAFEEDLSTMEYQALAERFKDELSPDARALLAMLAAQEATHHAAIRDTAANAGCDLEKKIKENQD